jgi:hypothetical protein
LEIGDLKLELKRSIGCRLHRSSEFKRGCIFGWRLGI